MRAEASEEAVQVLDGDNVFLAMQDQELHRRERADWTKLYFMPSSQDSGVKALRTWLSQLAEAVPWGPGAYDPAKSFGQSRRQVSNRLEQHTQHCPSCSWVSCNYRPWHFLSIRSPA